MGQPQENLKDEIASPRANQPVEMRGLVYPRHRACNHPAAPILKEYASRGCPVEVGRNWTMAELEAAVKRGPHVSAMKDDAIAKIQIEARQKAARGFATIHR